MCMGGGGGFETAVLLGLSCGSARQDVCYQQEKCSNSTRFVILRTGSSFDTKGYILALRNCVKYLALYDRLIINF